MKIPTKDLLDNIKEEVNVHELSNKLFQLGHEHEIDDDIIKFELTPNRGDCFSLNGILRDLNLFYSTSIERNFYDKEIQDLKFNFTNLAPEACERVSFLKLEIDNPPTKYEPYIDDYFNSLQINKNNFFTDISNYLSYETGQPTHAYDYSKLNNELIFKKTKKSKVFKTLLGKNIKLNELNYVFEMDGEIINLAGVVGGASTCCSTSTRQVLLECAYFKPEAIIGKATKYDVISDASHKFERGVDPLNHDYVIRRFIYIVSQHCNIKSISVANHEIDAFVSNKIKFDYRKVNRVLGTNFKESEQITILEKLGFKVGEFIEVPSFRHDIEHLNDIAEEIARAHGYDNFQRNKINLSIKKENKTYKDFDIKLKLLRNGFAEVINAPFLKTENPFSVHIDNPLDSNKKFLRTDLKESLISNLLFNEKRQKDSIKLFEIADIYTVKDSMIKKVRKLGLIASGRLNRNFEGFSKKIDKKYISTIFVNKDLFIEEIERKNLDSKIKNKIFYAEIDIKELSLLDGEDSSKSYVIEDNFKFTQVSEYPQIIRDLSFSLKNKTIIEPLQKLLFSYDIEVLKELFVFDFYENIETNNIKIGFRFVFQSNKKTLTDSEIDTYMQDIIKNCIKIGDIEIPGLVI